MWSLESIVQGVGGCAARVEKTTFSGISTDSRTIGPGEFFIPLKGPNFDGHAFIDAAYERSGGGCLCDRTSQEAFARSRGTVILVDDSNKALLDLASYKRGQISAAFVAITGSNGKTTTKELLVSLLRDRVRVAFSEKNYNNWVGAAKTMLAVEGSPDYCIFELGTNHRGEMRRLAAMVRPNMSLITNIAASHLEGLADLEGVRREKLELFEATSGGGAIFLNADDPSLAPYRRADCAIHTFGMRGPAHFTLRVASDAGLEGFEIECDMKGEKIRTRTRLLGRHNLYNVLAAATLAFAMGVRGGALADGIAAFEPYRGRFRPVRAGGGYTIIDDAYNANPASMEWALRTLSTLPCKGKRVAILGDMRELGDRTEECHRELGRLIRTSNLSCVLVVGEAMKAAASETENGRVRVFDDKKRLVEFAKGRLERDDLVLVKGSRALGLDEVVEALGIVLYHLFFLLHTRATVFNVFRYITFRTVLAILSALLISFLITPRAIRKFHEWNINNGSREDVPDRHGAKKGTPTMGGAVILIATVIPTLLWADLRNGYIWLASATLVMFGAIGFLDDYRKLKGIRNKGVSGRTKLIFEGACALAISLLIYFKGAFLTQLSIPFFKHATPDLGLFYLAVCVLIIVGASNGVNLTDGLDGLAIGPVVTVSATFLLFAYLAGNIKFAQYLQIFYVKGAGELTILCGAMLGAGIGFLWYNAYPAELFMGDTGSLSLGAGLGAIAVMIKQEFLLVIVGGIFVLESLSVILQVLSFKCRGKRVFRMAPIHHHFELKGWNEEKIVVRFWIISIILGLLALSTLKLR